jgi:hypothetical protein
LGYLARIRGLADGYVLGGLATILVLPILAILRSRGDAADSIAGRECGVHAASAGQGLPEAGLVDAVKRQPAKA